MLIEDELAGVEIKPDPVTASTETLIKRGRGRPRKIPALPVVPPSEITEAESQLQAVACVDPTTAVEAAGEGDREEDLEAPIIATPKQPRDQPKEKKRIAPAESADTMKSRGRSNFVLRRRG